MKKIILILAFFSTSTLLLAQNIDFFFTYIPDSYLPQLSTYQRQDLINKMKQGSIDSTTTTNYGGTAKLLVFDPVRQFMKIQTSEQGFVEIKKWTLPDSSAIFSISSWVCSPACDGRILFLKEDYTEAPMENFFPKIGITDFFDRVKLRSDSISDEDVKRWTDILFLHFEYNPSGDYLAAIYDYRAFLNRDDYAKLEPYMPHMTGTYIQLVWKNGRFLFSI